MKNSDGCRELTCPQHGGRNSVEHQLVLSAEEGCSCGGMAACQQCQDRDAASAATSERMLALCEREAARASSVLRERSIVLSDASCSCRFNGTDESPAWQWDADCPVHWDRPFEGGIP